MSSHQAAGHSKTQREERTLVTDKHKQRRSEWHDGRRRKEAEGGLGSGSGLVGRRLSMPAGGPECVTSAEAIGKSGCGGACLKSQRWESRDKQTLEALCLAILDYSALSGPQKQGENLKNNTQG